MTDHNLLELAPGRHALEDYFIASSVDEALAYLMSHHGRAQVIAGGTRLALRVQHDECLASHLVDVSSVGAMRRISIKDEALYLGGAQRFGKVGSDDRVRAAAPLLSLAAQYSVRDSSCRATLGGEIALAECPSWLCLALVAMDARAEITNVTGAQWLPVEGLFVRPGFSRVNSASEILTMLRISAQTAGQGSSMGRLQMPAENGSTPSRDAALALLLSLSSDGQALDWLSVGISTTSQIPVHLTEAQESMVEEGGLSSLSAERFASLVADYCREELDWSRDEDTQLKGIRRLSANLFDQAVESARTSLSSD